MPPNPEPEPHYAVIYKIPDSIRSSLTFTTLVWELAGERVGVFVPESAILLLSESRGLDLDSSTVRKALFSLSVHGILDRRVR